MAAPCSLNITLECILVWSPERIIFFGMISVLLLSLRSEEEDPVPLDLLPVHIQSVQSTPGAMLEVILHNFTEKHRVTSPQQ